MAATWPTLPRMLSALLLPLALATPESGEEHGYVEASAAIEVLYPPSRKEPRHHPGYGVSVFGVWHGEDFFKLSYGIGFDHIVSGWLGDPERGEPADGGIYIGTVPRSYRGHLFRVGLPLRFGIENEVAYGYVGAIPGYAFRVAELDCGRAPCRAIRAVDHGLQLGLSLGALAKPLESVGLLLGGEVGLDWNWFPKGQPSLATWNQGMNARVLVGWRF